MNTCLFGVDGVMNADLSGLHNPFLVIGKTCKRMPNLRLVHSDVVRRSMKDIDDEVTKGGETLRKV